MTPPPAITDDLVRRHMARALALARKGEGRVEPNPMVGCVIVKDGRVIGEGFHRRFGGPHAEVEALRSCKVSPRGATAYVSLEPCCHFGKTPPCTDAFIKAGVSRVAAGLLDPNPVVAGGGLRALRAAGVEAEAGLLATEAAEALAPYLTLTRLGRPYLIAKWAQSLDGKLAAGTGDSQWISSEASRRAAHRLRARVDAVLVGAGTVLADDPLLTARNVALKRRATRVVLDRRLRVSEKCQLVGTANTVPTLVLTTAPNARRAKADRLRRAGVDVIACRASRGRLSLTDALSHLAARGMTNVLLEGGPTLITAFLDAGLVDEAIVFTAPILLGGAGAPTAYAGRGRPYIAAAIPARSIRIRRIGGDVMHRLRLTEPPVAFPSKGNSHERFTNDNRRSQTAI